MDTSFRDGCDYPKIGVHEPALMVKEFLDLKLHLEEAFQHCNAQNIFEKCSSLLASDQHNIPLFSEALLKKFSIELNTAAVIQILGPYFTWTGYSLLSEIVVATHNTKAAMLLSQFEFKTDYSRPLKSYPIAKPAFEMCPKQYSTHTVLAVQLHCELQHLSLYDVLDIQNFIVKKCELTPHALQLLSVIQGSSVILYWMICRSVVPLVSSNFFQRLDDFHKKGIMLIAIYPNHIIATDGEIYVGPLSFITNFNELVRKLQ